MIRSTKTKNFSILSLIVLSLCSCAEGKNKPCVPHSNHYNDYVSALSGLKSFGTKGFDTSFFLNFEEIEECKNSVFYYSFGGICCDYERPSGSPSNVNYQCRDFGVSSVSIRIVNDDFSLSYGISCQDVTEYPIAGTISMLSGYPDPENEICKRRKVFYNYIHANTDSTEAAFGYKIIDDYDVFVTKYFDLVSDQDQHVFGSVTYSKDCPTNTITSINNSILHKLNNRN